MSKPAVTASGAVLASPGAAAGATAPREESPDTVDEVSEALARCAAEGEWRLADTPVRATIAGGPWTLGQGPATQANPAADFPNPNTGTQRFQPYFWPQVLGDSQEMLGYFDYRPRKMEEAVVAARSSDGGRSWTFLEKALDFNPNPVPDPINGNENGQGHPFIMRVRGETLLYTLDRTPGVQDLGGLTVHRLKPTRKHPLRGAPPAETPASASARTTGLLNPDGILGQVSHGHGHGHGHDHDHDHGHHTEILYLQRILGTAGPLSDVTTIRRASSADGIEWKDLGPVTGLQDDGTVFLGARGTLLRDGRGRYLLFFSGGTPADNASDAYRYIGYAESHDLSQWKVVRGLNNPLLSTQTTDSSGAPQPWWSGRVFGPSVCLSRDGRRATMIFAGFHTANASNDFADYRQIGRVSLEIHR